MTFHSLKYSSDDVYGWGFVVVVGFGFFLKLIWEKGLGFINEDVPKLQLAPIVMHLENSRQVFNGAI